MARVYQNLTALVGGTPLLEVSNIEKSEGLKARVIVKLEYFNPGGSVKDRIALAMIEAAERSGELKPGSIIIEATSGNTGIGLAWVASVKGYKLILTMPETMSVERQNLLKALGATLVLTPGSEGMKGALRRAGELKEEHPGSIILQQFENEANPEVHTRTTAEEIWNDTDGKVDIFVAGVGTGGTLSGTARALKANGYKTKIVAVEPNDSAVISGEKPGPHKIQGIGAGFIPATLETAYIDEIERVDNDEAFEAARKLAKDEGILLGISGGAALAAAVKVAKRLGKGKKVLFIAPDNGERYLSTLLYEA